MQPGERRPREGFGSEIEIVGNRIAVVRTRPVPGRAKPAAPDPPKPRPKGNVAHPVKTH